MKKLFVLFLFVMCAFKVQAAPRMYLSAPKLQVGDTLQIIFEDTQSIQQVPDLSELQKHFVIRGQQSSFNSTVINGAQSQSHQLILSVFPKEAGTFSIGPFEINQTLLPAQTVTVSPQTLLPAAENADSPAKAAAGKTDVNQNKTPGIFQVTAEVQPAEIYTGETALYTVRFVENIGLTQAQIQMAEEGQGYTLVPFGNDRMGQTVFDGQPVRFYERKFLLTPRQSGSVEIPAAGVIGYMPDNSKKSVHTGFPELFGNDAFFDAAFGLPQKEVYRQSQPAQLTVHEKPADWKGWWLPSRSVSLSETYQMPEPVKVGQPVERRVRLQASGVEGHQLPLLVQPAAKSIKVYANPDQRTQTVDSNGLTGYEEITFVLVPTESGTVTVPPIQVSWFNTQKKKKETAVLPAREIFIEAEEGGAALSVSNTQIPPQAPDPVSPQPSAVQEKTFSPDAPAQNTLLPDKANASLYLWGGLIAIFCVCLITGIVLAVHYRRRRFVPLENARKKTSRSASSKKPLPDLYPF